MTNDLRGVAVASLENDTLLDSGHQQQDAAGSLVDVPLHRRFRFWLPLLCALPSAALMFVLPAAFNRMTADPEFFTYTSFIVSELNRTLSALSPSLGTPICNMAVFFGFWYVIGYSLDLLRLNRASGSQIVPGWIWALIVVAFVEFVRDTTEAFRAGSFIFSYLALLGLDIRTLPPLVRINYWIVYQGVPIAWTSAWVLVLVFLGNFIRTRTNLAQAETVAPIDKNGSGALAGFLRVSSLPYFRVLVIAFVLLAGLVFISTHVSDSSNRTYLILLFDLPFACLYIQWLFPQFHFLRFLREQLRWRRLRVHLMFLGLLISSMLWITVYGDYLEPSIVKWSSSLEKRYSLAALLVPTLGTAASTISWLLVGLGIIFLYRIPFRKARRHLLFAILFLPVCAMLPDSVETTVRLLLFLTFYFPWLFPGFRLQPLSEKVRRWTSSLKPVHFAIAAVILVLLASVLIQNRETFATVLVDGTLLLFLRLIVPRTSRYRWIFYGGILAGIALVFVGSYNPERDLVLATLAFAACYGFWLFAERQGWKYRQRTCAILLAVSVWVLCSVGDAMPPDLTFANNYSMLLNQYEPQRFAALQQQYPGKHVGVALSGGGYRAALMHAGVLQGLEDARIPVTNISAVSGGSITGAYYALGGTPREVLNAILYRQFNTRRDLFDFQNVMRVLFSATLPGTQIRLAPGYSFGRSDVQAHAIDRVLLHDRKFSDLPAGGPRLMICVTDLNSGSALGLTSHWRMSRFLLHPPGEDLFSNVSALYGGQPRVALASSFAMLNSEDTRLSKAVAASGAFPLAFEPVPLSGQHAESFLMADGGVSDNSGMTLLLEADRRASLQNPAKGDSDWALDVAVSVDGGAMFQQDHAGINETSLDAAGRAVDIIHSRLGAVKPPEPRGPGSSAGPALVLFSPSLYMDNSRAYDYRRIGMYFMGSRPESDWGSNKPPLATQKFSVEQQQILTLIAAQTTAMDRDSLQLLTSLEGINQYSYAQLRDSLDKAALTPEEIRVLQEKNANPAQLENINQRRRHRIYALLDISLSIAADFSQCLRAFVTTQTLDDQINSFDSLRLYRLGKYLSILNGPQIRATLGKNPADHQPAVTPAEQDMVRCLVESTGKYAQDYDSYKSKQQYQANRQAANAGLDSCLQQFKSQNPALSSDIENIRVSF